MHPLNLCIDLGNTFGKAGFFRQNHLVEYHEQLSEKDLLQLVKAKQPQQVIISSVRKHLEGLINPMKQYTEVMVLNNELPVPFHNHYATPKTLGPDRIAGVIGARSLYPDQGCLVIDAGTCITYDFIDDQDNYYGGGISPGLQMRFNALHHFTQQLPLVTPTQDTPGLIGDNTQNAILSGVINGVLAEINGIMTDYREKFGNFARILCGGDAAFFESKIKESIFVASNLILIGLNRILIYNVEKTIKS